MKPNPKSSTPPGTQMTFFPRIIDIVTLLLLSALGFENFQSGYFNLGTPVNIWLIIWLVLCLITLAGLLFSWSNHWSKAIYAFEHLIAKLSRIKWLNLVIAAVLCLLFSIQIYNPDGHLNQGFHSRLAILWLVSLIVAFFLKACFQAKKFPTLLLSAILFVAAFDQAAGFFRDFSTYLFSLAWSEGSRFYYASLPFSQKIYGQMVPWSFLHPSRYLLMSIPFLFGNLPLWLHRGWQIFLWISLTALGCAAILKRFKLNDRLKAATFLAWCFVFFMQAPIYYHLMVCAILVLWGFDVKRTKKSLFFIILASLWAGISRVNWFPLPTALAILLYTLEKPFNRKDGIWKYIREPILFVVLGLGASLLSQAAYIPISGNQDAALFTTSFTADLLWYRLLPSPTYPVGILTGLLLLTSPLIILLAINFQSMFKSLHWVRRLIVLGILLVFLFGGLVVSVKIGGGSNLHNLDAFLLLSTVFCSYLVFDRIEKDAFTVHLPASMPSYLTIILVLVPVCWSVFNWEPFPKLDKSAAYQDLQRLAQTVQRSSASSQEILFISERHLLTFQNIKGVSLVPEYEMLTLMEMAISNNQGYLNRFNQDLSDQRFGLIIMDKQYVAFKDNSTAFPEENNAWVKFITIPVLEHYQPITWLRSTDTEIYAPRH